jgi:serine phosphatase RsbU (regulator of sigma subunit)
MTDDAVRLWGELRTAGFLRTVPAGSAVFREGDEADGTYVVMTGRCAVLEGDEQVNIISPGELFGEIGALGSGVRTATVVAVDDVELLFLSPQQLHVAMTTSPELVWESLRLLVQRLRSITARQVAYREEHKALREVQRSLLPDLSAVSGAGFSVEGVWEPCTYASGDYYDVIRLDEHRHLIALGDVMGHGAEASLMMAIARAQIREQARRFRRIDELLLSLDGYLRDNAPPKQGMSLVAGVFDRRTRVFEYGAAGHPFPLLLRSGEVSDLEGRPGLLLALPFLIGSGYERRELELEPGDRLLFFTDGFYEIALDDQGTQLARPGLIALFGEVMAGGEPAPLEALLRRIAELDVADEADDDRTALLVTVD